MITSKVCLGIYASNTNFFVQCIDTIMKKTKKTNWQMAYEKYLHTDDWKWVRQQVIKRDKCCQGCGEKYCKNAYFSVIHTSYEFVGTADLNEVESCSLYCFKCKQRNLGIPIIESIDDLMDRIVGWVE